MNTISLLSALKYAAAFASGYVGALLPVLATGDFPSQKALVAAFAPALLATGLFHTPGPQVTGACLTGHGAGDDGAEDRTSGLR